MNIYATGMNPVDSNALKRKPRVALFQAFVEMMNRLDEQDNHLLWRATKVGDELPPDTDVVIVSSMLPRSLNCPYALGVIWTISEALRRDIPLVLYLTDWAFAKASNEFKSIAKAGEEYFFKEIGGKPQYNEDPAKLRKAASDLLDVCRQYGDPNSLLWERAQVLVPRYTNLGDIKIVENLLLTKKKVLTFDPTPIFVDYLNMDPISYSIPSIEHREKRWILPSLLKDDTWVEKQHLKWPVERFGPKGFEVLPTEWDIQQEYVRSIGAICPPYYHEGSGWWRSRWIHAARARTILLCGSKDARMVGPAYAFAGTDYEAMTTRQLLHVANNQHEAILDKLQLDTLVMDEQVALAIQEAGA